MDGRPVLGGVGDADVGKAPFRTPEARPAWRAGARPYSVQPDEPRVGRLFQLLAEPLRLLGEGNEELKIKVHLVPRRRTDAGRPAGFVARGADQGLDCIQIVVEFVGRRSRQLMPYRAYRVLELPDFCCD